MKTLKRLTLNSLVRNDLNRQEMNSFAGGYGCSCACSGGDFAGITVDNSVWDNPGKFCSCGCDDFPAWESAHQSALV